MPSKAHDTRTQDMEDMEIQVSPSQYFCFFPFLFFGCTQHFTCSKSTVKGQQMALNSVVGALILSVAEITCPKHSLPQLTFPWALAVLLHTSRMDISFLEHAILLQQSFFQHWKLQLQQMEHWKREMNSKYGGQHQQWHSSLYVDLNQLPLLIEPWFMWNEFKKTLLLEKKRNLACKST